MRRTLPTLLLLALCVAPQALFAGGSEYSVRGEDLNIQVDSTWTQNLFGGYYPVRFRVENRGPARDLTFELEPSYREAEIPSVRKELSLEQNASAFFTLSIPIVGQSTTSFDLHVRAGGRLLERLERTIDVTAPPGTNSERPALLVVDPAQPDATSFETAVTGLIQQRTGGGHSHHYYGHSVTENTQAVNPLMLPVRWIDYSGVDLLAASETTWDRLSSERKEAILAWVQTGGNLLVYNYSGALTQQDAMNDAVGLKAADGWTAHGESNGIILSPTVYGDVGNEYPTHGGYGYEEESHRREQLDEPYVLKAQGGGLFATRPVMLGQVMLHKGDVFKGTYNDWAYVLQTLELPNVQWATRHGMSARQPDDEFVQFLNSDVKGVPVFSFVMLISLFAFVIGPLNYWLLYKKKKLNLLVVSIPLIAAVTSVTLFGYSLLAYGFGVKSRARTVTYVDQTTNTSVTLARTALFAGLAPSSGLEFSTQTAVYPIWAPESGFESGTVDWTDEQTLRGGWLKSRTRTQFLTVTHGRERGRLNVIGADGPSAGGPTVTVENGFEFDIGELVVFDEQGNAYVGSGVPAGGTSELSKLKEGDSPSRFLIAVRENEPDIPEGFGYGGSSFVSFNTRRRHYPYGYYEELSTSFAQGKLESLFNLPSKVFRGEPGTSRPQKTYIAVLKENPSVELGVETTPSSQDSHLLYGRY